MALEQDIRDIEEYQTYLEQEGLYDEVDIINYVLNHSPLSEEVIKQVRKDLEVRFGKVEHLWLDLEDVVELGTD